MILGSPFSKASPQLRSLFGGGTGSSSDSIWSKPFLTLDVENDQDVKGQPILRSLAARLMQINEQTGEVRKIGKSFYREFKPDRPIGTSFFFNPKKPGEVLHGLSADRGLKPGSSAYKKAQEQFTTLLSRANGRIAGFNIETDLQKLAHAGWLKQDQLNSSFDAMREHAWGTRNPNSFDMPKWQKLGKVGHTPGSFGPARAHNASFDVNVLTRKAIEEAAKANPEGMRNFIRGGYHSSIDWDRHKEELTMAGNVAAQRAAGKQVGLPSGWQDPGIPKETPEQKVAREATQMAVADIKTPEGELNGFSLLTAVGQPSGGESQTKVRMGDEATDARRRRMAREASEGKTSLWAFTTEQSKNTEYRRALYGALREGNSSKARKLADVGKISDNGYIYYDGGYNSWQSFKEQELSRPEREAKSQSKLASAVESAAVGYIRRGREGDADALNELFNSGEISNIVDLARAQADLNQAYRDQAQSLKDNSQSINGNIQSLKDLKEAQRTVSSIMGRFGDTKGEWYDWTRWQSARNSQWSGIKQAGSGILPSFMERPIGHLGDAMMTGLQAKNAPLIGAQKAFQQGVMPIISGATNIGFGHSAGKLLGGLGANAAGGVAAGSMLGPWGMIAGGAIGTVQGITQIIGQVGESRIQQRGFEIQSKLHLANAAIGLGKDLHGMIHRIIMAPLKLLGNAIKWSIPLFIGLGEAIRALTAKQIKNTERLVGRPNLAYTTDVSTEAGRKKGWYDFTWSRVADLRLGMPDGSTQNVMEEMEQMRQGLLLGKIPLQGTPLVASALLGNIDSYFKQVELGDEVGAWQHLQSFITNLRSHEVGARELNMIKELSPYFERVVTTIQATGDKNVTNLQGLMTDTNQGRLAQLANEWFSIMRNPNQYYDTVAEFETMRNIQDYQKMNMANTWWRLAGRSMETWWIKFLGSLERAMTTRDFRPVGQTIMQGVGAAYHGIKDTFMDVMTTMGLTKTSEKGEVKLDWGGIKNKIGEALKTVIPAVIDLYTSAWVTVAMAGYDIVTNLANIIWDRFYEIFYKFQDLNIDWKAIMSNVVANRSNIFEKYDLFGKPTGQSVFSFKNYNTVAENIEQAYVRYSASGDYSVPTRGDYYRELSDNGLLPRISALSSTPSWHQFKGAKRSDDTLHYYEKQELSEIERRSGTNERWLLKTMDAWSGLGRTSGKITYPQLLREMAAQVKEGKTTWPRAYLQMAEAVESGNVLGTPIGPANDSRWQSNEAFGSYLRDLAKGEGPGKFFADNRSKVYDFLNTAKGAADEALLKSVDVFGGMLFELLGKIIDDPLADQVRAKFEKMGQAIERLAGKYDQGQGMALASSRRYDLRTVSFMQGTLLRRDAPLRGAE